MAVSEQPRLDCSKSNRLLWCIPDTTEHRKSCYEKLAQAIIKAVAQANKHSGPSATESKNATKAIHQTRIQEPLTKPPPNIDRKAVFRDAILGNFDSSDAAFEAFSGGGSGVSRKQFKTCSGQLGLQLADEERKALRKEIAGRSKEITHAAWTRFFQAPAASPAKVTKSDITGNALAELPATVPELPESFKDRKHAREQLIVALLDTANSGSTAVTAPKSRVSSQVRPS